jgi:hypothetical protein
MNNLNNFEEIKAKINELCEVITMLKRTTDRRCFNCGEVGHLLATCRKIMCTFCQTYGHIAINCNKIPYAIITCQMCQLSGHSGLECPELKYFEQKSKKEDITNYVIKEEESVQADDDGKEELETEEALDEKERIVDIFKAFERVKY